MKEVDIIDFKSTIVNLYEKFSNLSFDAHHEAVYGIVGILPVE